MKSSILTIILTTLVATSPLCAQQNPKITLLSALAGCALSARIAYKTAYNTAYESTLQDRQIANFFKNKPMIMLFGEPITDEQRSLLPNLNFHDQGDAETPQFLFMGIADNAHRQELIKEAEMPDYQFVHPLEAGRPFPVVAYSHNLQTNNDVITFNAMLNKKYNEGKQEGDNEGYERGRTESSSGKIKDKVKEKVRDKLTN